MKGTIVKTGDLVKSMDLNKLAIVIYAGSSPIFERQDCISKILVQGETRIRYALNSDLIKI